MRRTSYALLTLGVCLLLSSPVIGDSERPQPVSPGSSTISQQLANSCPTFSWGGIMSARGYELVIYQVAEGEELKTFRKVQLPRGSSSWTPSASECPTSGYRYAWAVRVLGDGHAGGWSEALLFEAPGGPTADEIREALLVLKRYRETSASEWPPVSVPNEVPGSDTPPPVLGGVSQPQVSVSGKVLVTRNSTSNDPHVDLYESQSGDYARIKFRQSGSTNSWDLAGLPNNTASSGWLNIWSSAFGDVLRLRADGYVYIPRLGSGYQYPMCATGISGGYVGSCSSSRRYKRDLSPLSLGLETVMKMRPVAFHWKENGTTDFGFLAEEMEEIAPILAFHNEQGEPESVRYRQLTAILANAIQEQQAQIQDLQAELLLLQERLAQLRGAR